MMIAGKLIGALLGYFATGHLIGALFGALIGHLFDHGYAKVQGENSPERRREAEICFFQTLFRLLGYLAKADGRVSEAEVGQTEVFMDQMGLTAEHRREAILLFKEGAGADFDAEAQLAEFRRVCGRRGNLVQMLLVYLINIALADGQLDDSEVRVLRQVANALGIPQSVFEQLLRMIKAQNSFRGQGQQGPGSRAGDLDQAYEALGVSKDDSDATIKKAYRKLMSQYHPDKLMGQGMPEDMVKEATERSQEIQAAYDLIKRSRG